MNERELERQFLFWLVLLLAEHALNFELSDDSTHLKFTYADKQHYKIKIIIERDYSYE